MEQSPYSGRPVTEWIDPIKLVDANNDKVGDIVEVNPDFIVVKQGHMLGSDDYYYIPRTEVAGENDGEWSLRVGKDALETNGWTTPPTGSEWSTDTYDTESYANDMQATGSAGGGIDTTQNVGTTNPSGTRMRRYEEQLQAAKSQQQAGEVTLTKNVVEDVQTIQVPVQREEVQIERHAVTDGSTTPDETAFQGDTIRVPVMAEQVEIRKVPHVVEELEVSKTATQENQSFQDTVRREEVNVNDTTVAGRGASGR